MKGMGSAQEFTQPPPPGTYWGIIAMAEATFATSGASMLKLTPTIEDPRYPAFKGASCDDYIITDGSAKGGGMGKTKLRGCGIDVDSSDAEIADEAICAQLQGKGLWITIGNEQRMTRSGEEGPYNIPMTAVDTKTGQLVKLLKMNIKGYSVHNVGQAQAPAPVAQAQAPHQAQQFQQPPAQQFVQQNPQQGQQFVQPGQSQYQPVPQQPQFAPPPPQGGFAPAPGFAQPNGGLQPAFAPQAQPTQLQQAAPPWAGQQPPNGAPASAPVKRGKKLQVPGEDPGQPQG